jgi:hypothetical protein
VTGRIYKWLGIVDSNNYEENEWFGSSGNDFALYSGGALFEFRPEQWLLSEIFRGFSPFLQTNSGTEPQIRPKPLASYLL